MPRQYKRKRLAEYWSRDERPTKIRKSLNSSERQRGKSEAVSQLNGYEDILDDIQRLRWNLEIDLSSKCLDAELYGPEADLSRMLRNLGVGDFNLHRCTCEKIDDLSDNEILRRSGF